MGYIPPAISASGEFVGGIFPLQIPPTLKYSSKKNPLKKFPTLNINSLTPCMAVGKILAVAGIFAGRDCQILQIETQKRNTFTLSFLSSRDLQILLVEPAKNPRLPNFADQQIRVIIDEFY